MQAQWGKGTTIFSVSPQHPLQGVKIDETNPDHVFKAIVYNVMPSNDDEDGRVCLHSALPFDTVKEKESVIKDKLQSVCSSVVEFLLPPLTFYQMFKNLPNFKVSISTITPLLGKEGFAAVFTPMRVDYN